MVELLTVQLTTIYFVVSGIISLILSFYIKSFPIQFAVFAILGFILLVTTRSYLQKLLKKTFPESHPESLIGMQGIVVDALKRNHKGAVKVGRKIWAASATKKIKVGSNVKILEIDGMTLKVAPLDEEL